MVESEIVKEILSAYPDIETLHEEDNIVFFKLKGKKYGIYYLGKEEKASRPIILVESDNQCDYPHILPLEIPMDKDKKMYRFLCLNESGSAINYLLSYEEKIIDTINYLILLLSLTPLEIEEEFQKEFLFYWNMQTQITDYIRLYIDSNREFQRMNIYKNKNEIVRVVSNGIKLNDKGAGANGWVHVPNIDGFYIPIIDNRGILPPVKNKPWGINDLLNIIKGRDISRISHEIYTLIKKEKIKSNRVIITFEMIVQNHSINFSCVIHFKDSKPGTLMDKLEHSIKKIEVAETKRCDYFFLNEQIGNDTSIMNKKVAIIGAGSLGSYVATELVKSGIKNLTLYDGDKLEEVNVMRHRAELLWSHSSKVVAMKAKLELVHPEIIISAKNESLTGEILKRDMYDFDMIIFTVGSSDVQLVANAIFKKNNYDKPVLYSWLEAGGSNSHILKVDYSKIGCFECLYTHQQGGFTNNRANKLSDELVERSTIRVGCGATRVAYGTEILLRTTSVILDTIKNVFNGNHQGNCLLDIEPTCVLVRGDTFKERRCQCCGDRDN